MELSSTWAQAGAGIEMLGLVPMYNNGRIRSRTCMKQSNLPMFKRADRFFLI